MTRPGIEPRSPGPLANTLLIRPMTRHDDNDDICTVIENLLPILKFYQFIS